MHFVCEGSTAVLSSLKFWFLLDAFWPAFMDMRFLMVKEKVRVSFTENDLVLIHIVKNNLWFVLYK